MTKKFRLAALLLLFLTFGAQAQTARLTVQGNRFYMDGSPFDMLGLRVASASQSDSLTRLLIGQLDDYKSVGLNTISVYLQGSSGGFSDPFSPNGKELDQDHFRRLAAIVEACRQRSMVVIAGIFYQRPFSKGNEHIRRLQNKEAVYNAVKTVASLLKPYPNVIINIANEHNSSYYKGFPEFDFSKPENIIAMCRVVKETDPERIVGGGGYHDESNVIIGKSEYADVLLFDTFHDDVKNGQNSGWHYDYFRNQGVPDKPMVNVEIFGAWTRVAMPPGVFKEEVKRIHLAEIDEAKKRPGLSVCLHSNPWCQGPADGFPTRYELGGMGTEDDPGIRWWFEYAKSK